MPAHAGLCARPQVAQAIFRHPLPCGGGTHNGPVSGRRSSWWNVCRLRQELPWRLSGFGHAENIHQQALWWALHSSSLSRPLLLHVSSCLMQLLLMLTARVIFPGGKLSTVGWKAQQRLSTGGGGRKPWTYYPPASFQADAEEQKHSHFTSKTAVARAMGLQIPAVRKAGAAAATALPKSSSIVGQADAGAVQHAGGVGIALWGTSPDCMLEDFQDGTEATKGVVAMCSGALAQAPVGRARLASGRRVHQRSRRSLSISEEPAGMQSLACLLGRAMHRTCRRGPKRREWSLVQQPAPGQQTLQGQVAAGRAQGTLAVLHGC